MPSELSMAEDLSHLKWLVKQGVENVLFLCTGNICRSPVAEHLVRKEMNRLAPRAPKVISAGLMDIGDQPVVPELIEIGNDFGIDMKDHRSSAVERWMLEEANIIFVMETLHKERMEIEYPEFLPKVFLLSIFDFEINGINIKDPLGTAFFVYRHCFTRIYHLAGDYVSLMEGKSNQETPKAWSP